MLSIATWNANSGLLGLEDQRNYSAELFGSELSTLIVGSKVDILFAQEFPFPVSEPEKFVDTIKRNTHLTSVHFESFSQSHLQSDVNIGLLIASRLPITAVETIKIPLPDIKIKGSSGEMESLHERGLLLANCKLSTLEISLANIHLPPFDVISRDPAELIFSDMRSEIEKAIASFSGPYIIAGDFNCQSIDHIDAGIKERHSLKELIPFATRFDGRSTDDIVCSNHFLPVEAGATSTKSDHYWCQANLNLPDKNELQTKISSPRSITRILHLTDLHFGPGESDDVDWKSFIVDAERENRATRLRQYLIALDPHPDLVVITGDFTIACREKGLEESRNFIQKLISDEVFPSRDRIAVTPGNHDVRRRTAVKTEIDRWGPFLAHIGSHYPRPFLKGQDDALIIKEEIERQISAGKDLIGGVQSHLDPRTGEAHHIHFPFVFDREKQTLVYLFNSATISGSEILFSAESEAALEQLRTRTVEIDDGRWEETFEELLSLKYIDGSRVSPSELILFRDIMNLLRRHLGQELQECFLIAALHHHVSTIFSEEVKSFEITLNSGRLKKSLVAEGFNLVLHGHKHWPEAFVDSAISGGGQIHVISGSTVGGVPATGDAGFYVVDVENDTSAARVSFIPIHDENPRSIIEESLGSSKFIIQYGEGQSLLEPSFGRISRAVKHTQKRLSANLKPPVSNTDLTRSENAASGTDSSLGWNNFYNNVGISTLGTAYTLSSLAECGLVPPFVRRRSHGIRSFLLQSERSGGGWSASSGGEVGQPLESSIVLNGLSHLLSPSEFERQIDAFESRLTDCDDGVFSSNYMCCQLLDFFMKFRPDAIIVPKLSRNLMSGIRISFENGHNYWSAFNRSSKAGPPVSISPSVAHSAIVLKSLNNVFKETNGRHGRSADAQDPEVRWILDSEWRTEVVMVPQLDDHQTVINLLTDAICLGSLIDIGVPRQHSKIAGVVNSLLDRQVDGAWSAPDQGVTAWATLDVLQALICYRDSLD